MPRKRLITAACYAAFIAIGISVTILGPAKDSLTQKYGMPLQDGGIFLSLHYIGTVIGIVVAGWLLDRIDARYLLAGGVLLVGGGLLLLSTAATREIAFALMVVIGLGYGALDISPNMVVTLLNKERASIALNLLNIMWGIGAAVGPQVANFALNQGQFTLAFVIAGVFALALVIPFALVSIPPHHTTSNDHDKPRARINWIALLPFVALIFIYIGAENGFGGWIFTEVTQVTRVSASTATFATSLFWVGLTFGRIVASLVLRKLSDEALLVSVTLMITLGAGLLLVAPGVESLALISAFAVGVGCGPIFPITLAILNKRVTTAQGTVTGMIVALGTAGAIVVPPIQGWVGNNVSGGMQVTVILGLVLLGLVALVIRGEHRSVAAESAVTTS